MKLRRFSIAVMLAIPLVVGTATPASACSGTIASLYQKVTGEPLCPRS